MTDLRTELTARLRGRVCLVGLGNEDLGDDGLGMRLARDLEAAGYPQVVFAGTTPERCLMGRPGLDAAHVLLLDAVEFEGPPGAVVFLRADEIVARFPQVSTHRLSLGLLAQWIETQWGASVWLLGVKPQSLRPGRGLSAVVTATTRVLRELLEEVLGQDQTARARTRDGSACRRRLAPQARSPAYT